MLRAAQTEESVNLGVEWRQLGDVERVIAGGWWPGRQP